MASAQLSATPRSDTGKGVARSLRREGKVPGVIYGHAREPLPLALGSRELERLLGRISAETTVVELDLDGKTSRTLIREIQRDPLKRTVIHIDFMELVAGETVTVNVPVVLVGTPEGVRTGGGVLDQVLRELQVRVDPANMPNHIDIDITNLTIGHSIHVGDITVPEGVEILEDEEATIVTLSAPKTQAETPAEGEEASAEPEVIRAKKAEDEESK